MVYTFLIHSLSPKDCDILFYRFYTCYYAQSNVTFAGKLSTGIAKDFDAISRTSSSETDSHKGTNRLTKLFETSIERNEFLHLMARKIGMQYTMKVKHSLLPLQEQEASIRGVFIERKWKAEAGVAMPVVWQSAANLAFALVCKKSENLLQAQNILDIIVNQLEKHLQFISNPVVPLMTIETVSLIVNQYLPSGEIVFMNSKLFKVFEKQLETDLYVR